MVMYVSPAFSGLDGSTDCPPGTSKNAKHGEYPEGWGRRGTGVMGIELRCVGACVGKTAISLHEQRKLNVLVLKLLWDGNAAGGLGNLNPSH